MAPSPTLAARTLRKSYCVFSANTPTNRIKLLRRRERVCHIRTREELSLARLLRPLRFKLQSPERIPGIYALLEVLEKEFAKSTQALVLGKVSQFVYEQSPVSPMLFLNTNSV